MKMIGIAHRSVLSLACRSRPDMPGMRTSAIRQAISESRPEFSKSSADSNEIAPNPEALSRRRRASRSKSSSSTTATKFALSTLLISDTNLSPPSKNAIMISYSPVIYRDTYSRGEQNFVPSGTGAAVKVQALSVCGRFQSFRHAAQFSGRTRVHLMHYASPMDGGGNFARPEHRGDLLSLHTRNYEVHHFTLARSQAFVPFLQFGHHIPLPAGSLVALQGLLNRIEKLLRPEWFR